MELLWYGFVSGCVLGAVIYFGLVYRTPRCSECRVSTVILARQIAGSSPPIFELVYRCPGCGEFLGKRFVSTVSD